MGCGKKIIRVKMLGFLKQTFRTDQILLKAKNIKNLKDVLKKITVDKSINMFIDSETDLSLDNIIILVNGQESNLLDGLKTQISDGTEIVIIPVTHGG